MEPSGFSFYTVTVNFDTLTRLFERLGSEGYNLFQVGAELLLIGALINWCAGILHGTRGTRLLRGLLVVLIAATLIVRVLADQFGWARFELLYRYFIFGMAFIALIAFQPELRRALIRAGEMRFMHRTTPRGKLISALVESAGYLSRNRYGAVIAIQRDVGLANWAENGTQVNAEISANLLKAIFYPNAALHDLGVIIRGSRVLAAGCQFPVAESGEVDTSLGSRHRAAVGLSSESDALVLVVSEETGTISLADNGKLTRFLALDDLEEELDTRLAGHIMTKSGRKKTRTVSDIWRFTRRLLVVAPLTMVIWFLADQASLMRAGGLPIELSIVYDENQLDLDVADPMRFTLDVSGPTREVVAMTAAAAEGALPLKWTLPPAYARSGRLRLEREELRAILEELSDFPELGLFVNDISPDQFEFTVHEVVTVMAPVRLNAGPMEVRPERIEPEQVKVRMRRGDFESLGKEFYIDADLTALIAGAPRNRAQDFSSVVLTPRIGTVDLLYVDPPAVDIRLRVVAELLQRRLEGVRVQFAVSPQVWQRYEIELADNNEWLVGLDVEGDEARVNALRPQDIQALVSITSDQAVPTEEFRSVEITVDLPEGITLVRTSPQVRFRLIAREGAAP